MMKTLSAMLFGLTVLIGSSIPGMAADKSKNSAAVEEIAHETVTVQSVDVPNRKLTLKDDVGNVQTLDVSKQVKNLPQLKPGDRITVAFRMAMAAEIKKPGTASTSPNIRESMSVAPQGSKPEGKAQRTVKTLITVKEVDASKHMLTFEGPQANTRTIKVAKPEMQKLLKQLKPGDQVELAYTEELAVNVKPAKK
jgi:Cu/Ag efflux protein CusF